MGTTHKATWKGNSDEYQEGHARIFGKTTQNTTQETTQKVKEVKEVKEAKQEKQ